MAIKQHNGESNEDKVLKPDLDITYKHKSSIKRSEKTGITLENEKAIAMLEGDAASTDTPSGLAAIYSRTRLQTDRNVVYPNPESLKKRVAIIPVSLQYAAAAIILLLISIGAWFIFNQENLNEHIQYDLAKLESIQPDFGNPPQQSLSLEYRRTEIMQAAPMLREVVRIERLNVTPPDEIVVSSTIAATNLFLYTRPGSYQPPATSNQELAINTEPGKKTLMGKIFSGMFGRVKAPFESDNIQSGAGSSEGLSFWDIAELGVKGVNALGDHDYTVVRDYNDKGNVRGLIVVEE